VFAVNVSSTYEVSRRYIAPVAGSTISMPISPPIKILPKYHPFKLQFTGIVFSAYPSRVNFSLYDSLLKKPAPDLNNTVAGVCPVNTVKPLLFVIWTLAPAGLDFTVNGHELELTIEAQLVKIKMITTAKTGLKINCLYILLVKLFGSAKCYLIAFNFFV